MEVARAVLAILVLLLFASSSNAEEELLKKSVNVRLERAAAPPTCGKPAIAPVRKSTRIVGGDEAVPNSWPWQCRLSINLRGGYYNPWCGASVINKKFLVTAAHCVFDKGNNYARIPASKFDIVCGDHNKNTPEPTEQQATACKITYHKDYKPREALHDDIAIIELTKPLEYTKFVSPVCLPSAVVPVNTSCVVTGWGETNNTGDSSVLRQVDVPIVSQLVCSASYPWLTARHLCAGAAERKGFCFGDSGGPLVCKVNGTWELHGVVSRTPVPCAKIDVPGVYTNVTAYMPWIQQNTRDANCRCAKYLFWARHKRRCREYKAKFPNWN